MVVAIQSSRLVRVLVAGTLLGIEETHLEFAEVLLYKGELGEVGVTVLVEVVVDADIWWWAEDLWDVLVGDVEEIDV